MAHTQDRADQMFEDVPAPDPSLLERNLGALALSSPEAASRIRSATPAPVRFSRAPDGGLAGEVEAEAEGRARSLGSRRRPLAEAERFAEGVDLHSAGAVVVAGFGLGHHVRALVRRTGEACVVLCFEPYLGLLRAVLEREDHSDWLLGARFALLTDAEDSAAVSNALRGLEGLASIGVKVVEHPASRARLGPSTDQLNATMARAVRALRTAVTTTIVHIGTTLENLTQNIGEYAASEGIAPLRGLAADRPAVVVSAGPSLERNVDLLAQPGVRDRVVIIAVQTVLKTLLARGIRPHFVTALDHHEISRRFYEGLTAEDVEGVTLVVEPKANPAILRAWPGRVRCVADERLDVLLGEDLAGDMGSLESGATVAHLAYFMARHLGCDPVVLIGQDLGFTDGQYYAAGAAIHTVWSPELNAFRTLEMFEWERIARSKRLLHRATDQLGRPVYTDEQMSAYLLGFERAFSEDAAAGRTTIDATEGGVAKQHTQPMPLSDALARFATVPMDPLPETPPRGSLATGHRMSRLESRLRTVRQQTWELARDSRRAVALLREMQERHQDQKRVNALIQRVNRIRDRVVDFEPSYTLVHLLNQTGGFNRMRSDRELLIEKDLPPLERQRRQIDRDIENVEWIADAADQLGGMLDSSLAMLTADGSGIARTVRRRDAARAANTDASPRSNAAARPGSQRIEALVTVDHKLSGLGTQRDLSAPLFDGRSALAHTVDRLLGCARLGGVTLLTHDAAHTTELLRAGGIDPARVRIEPIAEDRLREGMRGVHTGRLCAPTCWRGGLGGLTCYDEALRPAIMAEVMDRHAIDAAVVVNGDWAMIDPGLVDAVAQRHAEVPDKHKLVFTQAPPGLAGALLSRDVMQTLAEGGARLGPFASLGGLLGYVPAAPQADPIAKDACVGIDPRIRDLQHRCIPDSPARLAMVRKLLDNDEAPRDAIELAERLDALDGRSLHDLPGELILELCAAPAAGHALLAPGRHAASGAATMPEAEARALIEQLATGRPDAMLTLGGTGNPLHHHAWKDLVNAAREAGVRCVHIRTPLTDADDPTIEALLESGADIISVDLLADSPLTYSELTGTDSFHSVRASLERLIELRDSAQPHDGLPDTWIVPRITRCDAVYEEIEPFYDRWLMACGACVIDPLPAPRPGERIAPLPVPTAAAARLRRSAVRIGVDGAARSIDGHPAASNAFGEGLGSVWASLGRHDAPGDEARAQVLVA